MMVALFIVIAVVGFGIGIYGTVLIMLDEKERKEIMDDIKQKFNKNGTSK
jgi:hypothetical protein